MKSSLFLLCIVTFALVLSAHADGIGGPHGYRPRVHDAFLVGDGCPQGCFDIYAYKNLFKISFNKFCVAVENASPMEDMKQINVTEAMDDERPRLIRRLFSNPKQIAGQKDSKADAVNGTMGDPSVPLTDSRCCDIVLSTKVRRSTCKAWLQLLLTGSSYLISDSAGSATGELKVDVCVIGSDNPPHCCDFNLEGGDFCYPCDSCWCTTKEERKETENRLKIKLSALVLMDATSSPLDQVSTAELSCISGVINTSSKECGACAVTDPIPFTPPLGLFVDNVANVKMYDAQWAQPVVMPSEQPSEQPQPQP